MQTLLQYVSEVLVRMSWQTAVLVIGILLVQRLFREHLTPRWRYALWLLVLGRLLLPVTPPSPVSVFNIAAPAPVLSADTVQVATPSTAFTPQTTENFIPFPEPNANADSYNATTPVSSSTPIPAPQSHWNLTTILLAIWLVGVLAFTLHVAFLSFRFVRIVRRLPALNDPALHRLLEQCKSEMGVSTPVALLESSQISSPALYGFIRPSLLLPCGLKERFNSSELRFIFLHELAHIKARDILVNWLITALQILHWFNPFVWFAFARMRADRELARDAMALHCTGEQESRSYGATIVKLLEEFSSSAAVPNLAGILENKNQMRARLQMILNFRAHARWSALALILICALALFTLTDAQTQTKTADDPFTLVDLKPALTPGEMADWTNEKGSFAVVPRGHTNLGGILFQSEGLIQLLGKGPANDKRPFRERVEIPLPKDSFAAIHLLGGMGWVNKPHGVIVAELVLTYSDSTTHRFPIQSGVHMRDWWRLAYEEPPRVSDPDSRVVWRGTHPDVQQWGKSLRLWSCTFDNPNPSKKVTKLELISAMNNPNLFITALTLDSRPASERPLPPADLDIIQPNLTGSLQVTVLDSTTSQPVPNARINSSGTESPGTPEHAIYEKDIVTDSRGAALLPYSQNNLAKLELRITAPNYGSWLTIWEPSKGETIPAAHTVKLPPGVLIGGTVEDDLGAPLPDAEISIARIWRGGEVPDRSKNRLNFSSLTLKTDRSGQWSTRDVPEPILEHIRIRVTHPDFSTTNIMVSGQNASLLKESSHSIRLTRGFEISGVVTDAQGKPVAGAQVAFGRRNYPNRRDTTADTQGYYRLANLSRLAFPEDEVITAQAPGFAPSVQVVPEDDGSTSFLVNFQLTAGATIRGKVIDINGNPLSRVRVSREGQPGGGDSIQWSGETDSEGKFVWDGAPGEPQSFYFGRGGYSQLRNVRLEPGDKEHLITLPPTLKLVGAILNAETQQPVTSFEILPAKGDEQSLHSWSSSDQRPFTNSAGTFELTIDEQEHNVARVTAKGFLTKIALFPEPKNNVMEISISLTPSAPAAGSVVDQSGNPVPGVQVALLSNDHQQSVFLEKGRISTRYSRSPEIATTDQAGRFQLTPQAEPTGLVAINTSGFGQISWADFQQTKTILVQPFGRIEGTLYIGAEPAPAKDLILSMGPFPGPGLINLDYDPYHVTTNPRGEFTFDSVPPGTRSVARLIPSGPRSSAHSHTTNVEIRPGETTRIQIGGTGVQIQGTIQLPPAIDDQSGFTWSGNFSTVHPNPGPFASPEAFQAWIQSPEYKSYLANRRFYAPEIRKDGTFIINDVQPGSYQFDLSLQRSSPGTDFTFIPPTGSAHQLITIPENTPSGTTIQLPPISLSTNHGLKLPDFTP